MDIKQPLDLISVIMPAYNRQESIAYSIESVLNQTYTNFELILIDDASSDNTHNIMRFYQNIDKRIKIVRNETNSRKSPIEWEPRNDGFKIAKGELISYLDSDNIWYPNFLILCSKPFFDNPKLKLVHCNSCNHYKDKQQYLEVLEKDSRALISSNNELFTAVYSYNDNLLENSGISWYIDTNEMMHRADIFRDLEYLWATRHPNRQEINKSQLVKCTYRRHNDQELAERIINRYGIEAVSKIDSVLVNFFYANTQAKYATLKYDSEITKIKSGKDYLSEALNVEFFYANHMLNTANIVREIFDFGVGELTGTFTDKIEHAFAKYAKENCSTERLTRYGGTASLGPALDSLAQQYVSQGLTNIDSLSITPCDGGHNALFHTFQSLKHKYGTHNQSRPKIVFMVPSYPYWSICIASGCDYKAIEAYDFDTYLDVLEKTLEDERIIGIVLNSPNNPLGFSITLPQVERLNIIARKNDCAIIVDIPYHTFELECQPLKIVDKFDAERTVYCDSISKSFALPGLRLGFSISKNADLGALIRAYKSASSLLPSSIKVDFMYFLKLNYPQHLAEVAKSVRDKMSRARKYILNRKLPAGIKCMSKDNFAMYDLFYLDLNDKYGKFIDFDWAEVLKSQYGIIVTTEQKLFPIDLLRTRKNNPVIRLSYGKIESIELGLEKFFCALEDICKQTTIKKITSETSGALNG